jgi:RNA polymerase primary sigma factor
MLDKVKFMETLRSIAEVAKVSESPLTKEEIQGYFDDMELTEEQLTMVFQYLQQPQDDRNEGNQVDTQEQDKPESEDVDYTEDGSIVKSRVTKEKESVFLKMYLEDIDSLPTHTNSEVQALYMQLINGDAGVIQDITDFWLSKVVEIGRNYASYPVIMEDLIQEGNLGLLSGIQQLLGSKKIIDVEEYLKESVQQAIENYIDEVSSDDDWENTILAKTTLINEARKALAEENAEIPTIPQLSEYTKISEQEIEDILRLSKD